MSVVKRGGSPDDQQASEAAAGFPVPFSAKSPFDGVFTLRVLVDTCVVEVYAGAPLKLVLTA